jgi:hypothetical protein
MVFGLSLNPPTRESQRRIVSIFEMGICTREIGIGGGGDAILGG